VAQAFYAASVLLHLNKIMASQHLFLFHLQILVLLDPKVIVLDGAASSMQIGEEGQENIHIAG